MVEMIGERFGKLVVVKRCEGSSKFISYTCDCDCGNSKDISGGNLRSGHTKSCGCSRKSIRKNNRTPKMGLVDKKAYFSFLNWNKTTYGITEDEYRGMMDNQRGCCDSCKDSLEKVHVDHDHTTGVVRGLLCPPCNMAAGLLKDSSEVGMRLVTYLMKHGK